MTEIPGPVFELNQQVDPGIVDQFDAWLAAHNESMQAVDGVVDVQALQAPPADGGRCLRTTRYFFADESSLDAFLELPASDPLRALPDDFAGHVLTDTRILTGIQDADRQQRTADRCLNCGAVLGGQYCGQCGQRAQSRLISVWELTRDAFGDLFELDSRLWRTLGPLAFRPGSLTRDYLLGRRARYMPPFRTYLVLSIVFFLVAFFDPRQQFSILYPPDETATPAAVNPGAADEGSENLGERADQGAGNATTPAAEPAAGAGDTGTGTGEGNAFSITFGSGESGAKASCDDLEVQNMPDWLASRLTPDRLNVICERLLADNGRAFGSRLVDNIPAALFFLLPLMALVLKMLYPLSKRYYVEHLLFVVHFHAFVFLILTVQILCNRMFGLFALSPVWSGVVVAVVTLYIPIYLYKALRRVYRQNHFLTATKFLALCTSYFAGLSLILMSAVIYAVFTI